MSGRGRSLLTVCVKECSELSLLGLTMQTHGVMKDQHHFIQGNGR